MNLLLSSLVVTAVLIPLIVALERARPRPRDLMPVIVLAAIAIVGRIALMPIPNFQPATALIVLAGLFFGRHAGLLCGMLVALVSNMVLGHGPWTPWQMLAWGGVGYFAGVFFCRDDQNAHFFTLAFKIAVLGYGIAVSLLYGLLMDVQFFIAYAWQTGWTGLMTTIGMGLPMNVSHAVSTSIFLALTLVPWGKKLHRLRTKYGINSI
ncbi:MAG: ECF transporter S component [Coriobacteriia bacterium]|nr:ECF transporter S component [Coriobacteriia bacterium]